MRTYTRKNTLKECIEPIEGVLGLCRLCLEEAKDSIPIFTNKSDMCTSLAARIMMCVGYEITREDSLPNTICLECQKKLNNYYEFRKKCTATYHRLKTHLLAVQVKTPNDVNAKLKEEANNSNLPEEIDEPMVSSTEQITQILNQVPELDVVNTRSQRLQNGLDAIINKEIKGLMNGTDIKGVEDNLQKMDLPQTVIEVCPDVTEFLSSILVEMGILKKHKHEVLVTENCTAIHIETGDSEHITLEVFEIEEVPQNTTLNMLENIQTKAKTEATKVQPNDRPKCALCGKCFSSASVLRRHLRTHTGERPHTCAQCGRAFAQRAVLRRHELVHQELRPFPCARCPKRFTQAGALAAHARAHSPGSPAAHRCGRCPKVFQHASGLTRHAKTHVGCIFQCPLCQRSFSDKSSLRRHTKSKHASSILRENTYNYGDKKVGCEMGFCS